MMALPDELQRLEQVLSNKLPDGHSVQELMTLTGHDVRWVRAKLGILSRASRLVVGRKRVLAIDGRSLVVPAYKVSPTRRSR